MGCCNSTPTSSPQPAALSHPTSSHPPSTSAALPSDPTITATLLASRAAGASNNTSSTRPNAALRAPSPVSRSPKNVSNRPPPWTRSHLAREREVFFETRVTGRPEVWSALRLICEELRRGDVAQAQAMMSAAGVTCPSGRFARSRGRNPRGGVYDERGALYDVHEWVVVDPGDLVEDTTEMAGEGKNLEDEDEEEEDGREEKGKGRAESVGEEVLVRVRLSDGSPDLEVLVGEKQTAGVIVRRVREKMGRGVRLLYLGKPVEENKTLGECGWRSGQMLNAFLFNE
ncbi:unnamed protein product [Zymoseptoria tritici ST99CH_3D1]|nr:unnamed protein product [Zymoseptoria tritici ST99CH_3D1]